MKVGYKKTKLLIDILLGIIFIIFAFKKGTSQGMEWSVYLIVIIGVGLIGLTLYKFTAKYIVAKEDSITFTGPPSKTFTFDEITEAAAFPRGYIIKSGKKTMRITKSNIDKKQVEEFDQYFNEKIKPLANN